MVDGHPYLDQDISSPAFDAFREPFYLQIDLVVDGAGDPLESTEFPQHLIVDYVRVFR
jgi:hypothetical protein